ncbi:uv radiation resistance protein [Pelomyxa schiedti]|nr:uv radiation resistance protein [Pelomyxa schiedti]
MASTGVSTSTSTSTSSSASTPQSSSSSSTSSSSSIPAPTPATTSTLSSTSSGNGADNSGVSKAVANGSPPDSSSQTVTLPQSVSLAGDDSSQSPPPLPVSNDSALPVTTNTAAEVAATATAPSSAITGSLDAQNAKVGNGQNTALPALPQNTFTPSIIVMNSGLYFTLHEMDADGSPKLQFYTSETCRFNLNPTWRAIDTTKLPLNIAHTISKFIVCLWLHTTTRDFLVSQEAVTMSSLCFIALDVGRLQEIVLPQDCMLFELHDGLYITRLQWNPEENVLAPGQSSAYTEMKRKNSVSSYDSKELIMLLNYKQREQRMAEEVSRLEKRLTEQMEQRQHVIEKLQRTEALRVKISTLQNRVKLQQSLLEMQKEQLAAKRAELNPRAEEVTQARAMLACSIQNLLEKKQLLKALQSELHHTQSFIELRKWQLASEVQNVYVIENTSEKTGELTIAGIKLPDSQYGGCDEEIIASGLGNVCHAVHLISGYLEIPLRYPMSPMGSRSTIRDESISQQSSPKFPLYSHGVAPGRFEYGVFLLNKNIEQILNAQGHSVKALRATLANLQTIYEIAFAKASQNLR